MTKEEIRISKEALFKGVSTRFGYGASGSAHTAAAQGLLPDAPGPRLKKTGAPDMRCKANRTVLDSGGGASGTTAASASVGQIASPGRI